LAAVIAFCVILFCTVFFALMLACLKEVKQ
jgi:hypothetical protein